MYNSLERTTIMQWLLAQRANLIRFVIWLCFGSIAVMYQFTAVYLIFTAFYLIFINMSTPTDPNRRRISAYAPLNTDGQRMAGSLDAAQFENELRHRNTTAKSKNPFEDAMKSNLPDHPKRKSKLANALCVCGSGRKYKVCCSPLTESKTAEEQKWKEYEQEWLS